MGSHRKKTNRGSQGTNVPPSRGTNARQSQGPDGYRLSAGLRSLQRLEALKQYRSESGEHIALDLLGVKELSGAIVIPAGPVAAIILGVPDDKQDKDVDKQGEAVDKFKALLKEHRQDGKLTGDIVRQARAKLKEWAKQQSGNTEDRSQTQAIGDEAGSSGARKHRRRSGKRRREDSPLQREPGAADSSEGRSPRPGTDEDKSIHVAIDEDDSQSDQDSHVPTQPPPINDQATAAGSSCDGAPRKRRRKDGSVERELDAAGSSVHEPSLVASSCEDEDSQPDQHLYVPTQPAPIKDQADAAGNSRDGTPSNSTCEDNVTNHQSDTGDSQSSRDPSAPTSSSSINGQAAGAASSWRDTSEVGSPNSDSGDDVIARIERDLRPLCTPASNVARMKALDALAHAKSGFQIATDALRDRKEAQNLARTRLDQSQSKHEKSQMQFGLVKELLEQFEDDGYYCGVTERIRDTTADEKNRLEQVIEDEKQDLSTADEDLNVATTAAERSQRSLFDADEQNKAAVAKSRLSTIPLALCNVRSLSPEFSSRLCGTIKKLDRGV